MDSSSLRPMLLSLCEQITTVYGISGLKRDPNSFELKLLIAFFHMVIKRAAASQVGKIKPLVIMLDSLDQLSHDGQPQGMNVV